MNLVLHGIPADITSEHLINEYTLPFRLGIIVINTYSLNHITKSLSIIRRYSAAEAFRKSRDIFDLEWTELSNS